MPSTMSSFVAPFSSCPQSLPASGSFPVSQFRGPKYWSFSFSISPSNIQDWSPLGWTGWIPLNPRDSQESSPTPQFKGHNSSALSFLQGPTLYPYMTTGKTIALTRQTFIGKVTSLLFNMLSRLVITFLPRHEMGVQNTFHFKCLFQERHNSFKQLYPWIRQKLLHYMYIFTWR